MHNLFPLAVYREKAGISPALRKKLAAIIVEQRKTKKGLRSDQSATWTGDVQGLSALHHDKNFKPLVKAFHKHMQAYLHQLGHQTGDVDVYVTRCWGTVANGREHIPFHRHRNSALSIIYYPSLPEGSANLAFENSEPPNEPANGMISPDRSRAGKFDVNNPLSTPQAYLPVEEDDIVLFPSGVRHGVPPGNQNGLRISVAADTLIITNSMVGDESLLPPVSVWRRLSG